MFPFLIDNILPFKSLSLKTDISQLWKSYGHVNHVFKPQKRKNKHL